MRSSIRRILAAAVVTSVVAGACGVETTAVTGEVLMHAGDRRGLATDDPAGFEAVVDLWSAARTIVDELAPDTTVIVTFQYEWLLGRRGGWFGRADYYRQIVSYTDLPVIFSEIGWTADATIPLLPGGEAEQAAYVDRFFESTAELDREVAIWSFVWSDQVDQVPFAGMGLPDSAGLARPAWERWVRNR